MTGITHVTRRPAVVTIPPDGEKFRYGTGSVFQAGPRTAGVFLNLRFEGFPVGDFEAGMDAILFDGLDAISPGNAVKITRSDYSDHPVTGKPRVTVKHSQHGGFVPHGALRPDGTPHPAAGTGFLLGDALNFPSYGDGYYMKEDKTRDMISLHELSDLAYDGETFSVTGQELRPVKEDPLRAPGSDWKIISGGLRNAIPDGDDLLFAVTATRHEAGGWSTPNSAGGISRWQYRNRQWRPVSFVPVFHSRPSPSPRVVYGQTLDILPGEGSIARGRDGSLLYTARWAYGDVEEHMIQVARSTDGGESWTEVINVPDVRGESPITINEAADGTLYIVSNKIGHERDWIMLWPLHDDHSGLGEPITVRNGLEDFGPPPSGMIWFMDHPTGAVVRLADGQWHGLLSYRVLDRGEHGGGAPTPFTGHYVEEVISTGEPQPPWRF